MDIFFHRQISYLLGGLMAIVSVGVAQVPLSDPNDHVIRYGDSADLADPIALLQKKLARGELKLNFESSRGYLTSVLRVLDIPTSSQTLVFSKTSGQRQRISPQTPRALYFNDDVYVGWVPNGDAIEISDMDPEKGTIFYSLKQSSSEVHFERSAECMQCHVGPKTEGVPGNILRSVFTAPDGYPLHQISEFVVGHSAPLSTRWGGWYVTGTTTNDVHLGNSGEGSLADLTSRFNTSRYLSPYSDVVALMVLSHQIGMQNLITRANYETRYALDGQTANRNTGVSGKQIANIAEPLLEYMLFRHEAPLNGPISGSSGFAEDFQRRGPRDSKGRSLRDLDLKTRLLRYPCSYLIYSQAFDGLPQETRQYLWHRLSDILSGKDHSKTYETLSAADRQAIFEILRETKPEFAAFLRTENRTDKEFTALFLALPR